MIKKRFVSCLLVIFALVYVGVWANVKGDYKVIASYPHDTNIFTQGLAYDSGILYESSGGYGKSTLSARHLNSVEAIKSTQLPDKYFAEGITILGDNVYQLTFLAKTGFVYDKHSLEHTGRFFYDSQGWGLTNDGKHLIMSDGTDKIRYLDPANFNVVKTLNVRLQGGEIKDLNDITYVDGFIFANIWRTPYIAKIDETTGQVITIYDLSALNPDPEKYRYPFVLNGITYDTVNKVLLITGKSWPVLYMIILS